MERVDQESSRTNNTRLIIGLVFITLGALLFADRFDIIPFNWNPYIFTWQSLLIGIGLISLAKSESRTTGLVLIAIGGIFLASKIMGYSYPLRYFFWPTVFIGVGLILIFQRRNHHRKFGLNRGVIDMDYIDDVAIFGGSEQKVNSKNFKGGKLTNIFGGSTFDMSDTVLAPGRNTLDMFCLFGGSKIIVPPDWKIKIEVTAIFGGYADKRRSSSKSGNETNDSEFVIRGVVIFGGGEIKSY